MHGGRSLPPVGRPGALRRRSSIFTFRYGDETLTPGKANNTNIFPAIRLAIYAAGAERGRDEIFAAAGRAAADQATQSELDPGLLSPPQTEILQTEIKIALQGVEIIFECGLAGVGRRGDLRAFLESQLCKPEYRTYGLRTRRLLHYEEAVDMVEPTWWNRS